MKQGWEIKKLGEVCESDLGKTLNQSKDTGELRPYLCAINVLWDKIDFTTLKETRFEDSELERYTIRKGDLLICEGGDIGRAAIWNYDYEIQYQNALHLFPLPESQWRAKVFTCSSVDKVGLEEVWNGVEEYLDHIEANGYFQANRNRQNKYWMYETINETLKNAFYRNPEIEGRIAEVEQRVLGAKLSSFIAAKELLDIYFGKQ